jgi:hypothetical protein
MELLKKAILRGQCSLISPESLLHESVLVKKPPPYQTLLRITGDILSLFGQPPNSLNDIGR